MRHDADTVRETLSAIEGADVSEVSLGVVVRLPVGEVKPALRCLKERDDGFEMFVDLFGTDTGDGVEITYFIRSIFRGSEVYVRTVLPYDAALPSVWSVYPAALLPEREISEMFGLSLIGHPNPARLLTVDGSEPFLLKRVRIRSDEEVRG